MDSSVLFSGVMDLHPVFVQRVPVRAEARQGDAPQRFRWEQPVPTASRAGSGQTAGQTSGQTSAFAVYVNATIAPQQRVGDSLLLEDVENVLDDAEQELEAAGFAIVRSLTLGFLAARPAAVEAGSVTRDWRTIVTVAQSSHARLSALAERGVGCAVFVHADSTLARPLGTGFTIADEDAKYLMDWLAANAENGIHYTTGSVRELADSSRRPPGIP